MVRMVRPAFVLACSLLSTLLKAKEVSGIEAANRGSWGGRSARLVCCGPADFGSDIMVQSPDGSAVRWLLSIP
jgi:hypothetical protein